MKSILTLKPWKIFAIFLSYEILLALVLNALNISTSHIFDTIFLIVLPMSSYPFLLGLSLIRLPQKQSLPKKSNEKLFIFYWILWMILWVVIENISPNSILMIPLTFFWGYSFFRFGEFAIDNLRRIELGREPGFWESIIDVFQLFAWPLCIWWLQTRVNQIYERKLTSLSL